MKKITPLLLLLTGFACFSQQKSTGNVTLSSNMTVNLTLNSSTLKATLVFTGPSDRWFALQFGTFSVGSGMSTGQDLVFTNNTTLIDGNMDGVGNTPNNDAIQNWTVSSNTISSGIRTITAQRDISTGDANDYTFNYANSTIDFAWARSITAGYTLNNHGVNLGYAVSTPISTNLGIADFSLKAATVYPNPSNGNFSIETKSGLDKINIYSQIGSLVKTIEISDQSNKVDVNLKSLQKGIYLIELQSGKENSWKKIIID